MAWQHIRIARFGGPEVLELAEQPTIPDPGPVEVRIKVLAAGTGFTDTFIPARTLPRLQGVTALHPWLRPDLSVVDGYAHYAIRPARFLVPVPARSSHHAISSRKSGSR